MEFIFTDPSGQTGEQSELIIWNDVKEAFQHREGIAYWRYPLFTEMEHPKTDTKRKYKEPDILIVDRVLGLIIIEVKGCNFDQIEQINGTQWKMSSDFYKREIEPYGQAKRQIEGLLKYCNRELELKEKVPYRILIGLPWIDRRKWQGKFGKLPSAPPVLCRGEKQKLLLELIQTTPSINNRNELLSTRQWKLLLGIVAGHSSPEEKMTALWTSTEQGEIKERADVLVKLNNRLFELDIQQEKIGKQIPPGPQRIRGIAGSGKTTILCQRAAHLHLKYPDWEIAVVFFTRSLYEQVRQEIDRWLRRFSCEEVTLEQTNGKLKIFHAWGAEDEPGFYSFLRGQLRLSKILPGRIEGSLIEKLAQNCRRILENDPPLQPCFDAVLIDEGQDLMVGEPYKFDNRQTIYWLAWQSLHPIASDQPHLRRLYWAYDEFQSLNTQIIPNFKELFGAELSEILVGKSAGVKYKGDILKNEVMKCCFRTPRIVLMAAITLGMGLLRSEGRLYRCTKKTLTDIGFEVEGDFRRSESLIRLWREPENCLNPISQLWKEPLLEFRQFKDRREEVESLADEVRAAIDSGFEPDRQLMIVPLGENQKSQQAMIAESLRKRKIDFFIPGEININTLGTSGNRSIFWRDGAVTVSDIYRAKGNEATWVFLVGLDNIAKLEDNYQLRNQLFVAMTRTKGWLWLSGLKSPPAMQYSLYQELQQVINIYGCLEFRNRLSPTTFDSVAPFDFD